MEAKKRVTTPATRAARTIVTIATQRSGTKAFAQALNAGQLVRSVYEIFLPENREASLIRALVAHIGTRPDFAFGEGELTEFLDGFFAALHARQGREWLHCDVMYNNLGTLSPLWTFPVGLPWRNFLLGYFRSRGFYVVHLVRENLLDCFASKIIAEMRNLYHTDKAPELGDWAPIRLDPEQALHQILPAARTRELVREAFRGVPRYLELTYPDFLDDTRIAPAAAAKCAELLGLPAEAAERLFGPVRMRPTAPDKRRLIANYDEVAAHVAPELAALEKTRGPRW
jgi:hypothetical protein